MKRKKIAFPKKKSVSIFEDTFYIRRGKGLRYSERKETTSVLGNEIREKKKHARAHSFWRRKRLYARKEKEFSMKEKKRPRVSGRKRKKAKMHIKKNLSLPSCEDLADSKRNRRPT